MAEESELRGALRQGDWVEYQSRRGREIHPVVDTQSQVFINGVPAARTGDPLRLGGRVGEPEHDVHLGDLPGGEAGGFLPVRFHLHVDADRDGEVDDLWQRNDEWSWSRGGLGAIMMVNLDPAGKYGPCRAPAIAPLVIRRDPATAEHPVDGWRGYLRVSSQFKVRILASRTPGAAVLLGPESKDAKIALDLSRDEIALGMEGVQFPGFHPGPGVDPDPATRHSFTPFDGLVRLFLELHDPDGKVAHHEVAQVRVAPWVASSHFDPSEEVYYSNHWPASKPLEDDLQRLVPVPLRAVTRSDDQWTQDEGEIGFSSIPGKIRHDQRSILTVKGDALAEIAGPGLLPFNTLLPTPGGSLDLGGNVECTPPFVHPDTGRVYAFGRLYHGGPKPDPQHPSGHSPMTAFSRLFFQAQAMQDPIEIDTGWLTVGHVDEIVSFLPMNDARLGFRVLWASPHLARRILEDTPDDAPIFQKYDQDPTVRGDYRRYVRDPIRDTAAAHYRALQQPGPGDVPRLTAAFLKGRTRFNVRAYDWGPISAFVEERLAVVRDTFKRELGLDDDDFIPVPTLFRGTVTTGSGVSARAFTPGVVNGLVVTQGPATWGGRRQITFIAPKPFCPQRHADGRAPREGDCVFEEHVLAALGPASRTGVTAHFADDFINYHIRDGEVHCGTNTRRTPPADRVWWAPQQDSRR